MRGYYRLPLFAKGGVCAELGAKTKTSGRKLGLGGAMSAAMLKCLAVSSRWNVPFRPQNVSLFRPVGTYPSAPKVADLSFRWNYFVSLESTGLTPKHLTVLSRWNVSFCPKSV